MADPRNTLSFEGIGENFATFVPDGTTIVFDSTQPGGAAATMIGKAVSLSTDKTVQLTSDGDAVVGKLILVESDLKCNVQVRGCMTLPGGLSATLTDGTTVVGATSTAAAKGYIRSTASGTAAELIKGRGQIWDASDATNVVVFV